MTPDMTEQVNALREARRVFARAIGILSERVAEERAAIGATQDASAEYRRARKAYWSAQHALGDRASDDIPLPALDADALAALGAA